MLKEEALRRIADALIEESTKKYYEEEDRIGYMLMLRGMLRYKIEAYPGAGHNYYILLEQIYEYYKKHPETKQNEIFYEMLMKSVVNTNTINELDINMNYIYAQMKNEKEGKAAFKIDVKLLLEEVKNRIEVIKEKNKEIRLQEWIDRHNNYLNENYGHKII